MKHLCNIQKKDINLDKPISDFQAISFKLADMATEIMAAELLIDQACDLKNREKMLPKNQPWQNIIPVK